MAQVRIELEKDEIKEMGKIREEIKRLKEKDKIKLIAFLHGVRFAEKA